MTTTPQPGSTAWNSSALDRLGALAPSQLLGALCWLSGFDPATAERAIAFGESSPVYDLSPVQS